MSVLIKMFEKIIRDKMINFLESNDSITDNQHSFLSNRSCHTNLLIFVNDVYSSWDTRAPYDIIYLDSQKEFNKVPHIRLISKLYSHGKVTICARGSMTGSQTDNSMWYLMVRHPDGNP